MSLIRVEKKDGQAVSMWRRAAAGVLDLVAVLCGAGAWLRFGRRLWVASVWSRVRGAVGIGRDVRIADVLQTRRGRVVLQVGLLVLVGIPLRNWRSPGARIVGIEMVNARTGGPLTIRSVVISDAVGKLFAAAI